MTSNPRPGHLRRVVLPLLAGGLTALVLPWSSASAGEEPAFTGYNTSAWAAPVRIEIYEPMVPIPATPQLEVLMAYTRAEAETGVARGRSSWLWPGDPIGEGAKTFADAIGLPDQIGEAGYPVQVNSEWPNGPEQQKDEPFPGTIMRTSAQEDGVEAQVGVSPDGKADEPEPAEPGEPGLPGLPGSGDAGEAEDTLAAFGQAITGQSATTGGGAADDDPEDPPDEDGSPVPPQLAALVDVTGYTSQSRATTLDDEVSTYSRSAVGDVSLIGGLVTIEGVRTRTVTASDGDDATADGRSVIGTMSIAGTEFSLGPDGVEAAGQTQAIPGLPDEPKAALAQLGLSFAVPEPALEHQGDRATSLVRGLVVEIDMAKLRAQLKDVPLGEIIDQVPDETRELKSLLQAMANLSPRIVVTLGNAGTLTDTVEPLAPIATPTTPPTEEPGSTPEATPGTKGDGPQVPPAGSAAPGAPADAAPTSGTGTLTGAQPMGDGLPPLNSIPGALTVGGIVAATAAGSWLRKIGAVALGGVGTCPHGLDSGLPDLRKA